MKGRFTGILIAFFVVSNLGAIVPDASNNKIPESSRVGKDIPEDVVWDENEGIYKLIDSKPVFQESSETTLVESHGLYESFDKWIDQHKDSENPLDKAMIKWIRKRKSEIFKSYYSPDEDETFKEITDLGIKYLPEMVDRIQKDDGIQTGVLMSAVAKISKIDSLKGVSLSPDEMKQWDTKYKNALKKAPLIIKNSYELDSLKKDIKECGIFVAPYIAEAEKRGDYNLASVFDVRSFSNEELKIIKDMVEKNHHN